MSSSGKPYCITKRGRYYYALFKLPSGEWSSARSTGETTKGKAEAWAINYIQAGIIVTKNSTFREYAENFFDWNGAWATDKRVRGLRVSQAHCKNSKTILVKHLFPLIGDKKLSTIDRAVIRNVRNDLFNQGYKGTTINKTLSTLRVILETALDESLIQYVPKIDRAAEKPNRKGILTVEEVRALFSTEWQSDPAYCHPPRELFMGYAGNLLSCSTGIRLGEVQALTVSDVHLDESYIHVRRSWDRLYGLKETTKTGIVRNIIIPRAVVDVLGRLIAINPEPGNPDSFVFFAEFKQGKPAEAPVFTKSLYTAMRHIGISEEDRRARKLSFHSHRYFFNSLMINAKVPLLKIQALTGHRTDRMSAHYYQNALEDLADIRAIQEGIFSSDDPPGSASH
ncbi:MAG: tyrosine-type recombinase/integrase [Spirochaetes bacterium]|nr:tyrosine-type recombinase/integrase [Spirochaetota bacterium]